MLPTQDSLQIERHAQTETKGIEKDRSWKWTKKNVAILIPDKIDFSVKSIAADKEESNNSTSGYLSEETPNTNSKRQRHLCIHCSIIYNNQGMEAT